MLDKSFFNPRSVAVIGASGDPTKLGHVVLKNILEYGYKGKVFPVNPSAQGILNLPVFPRVTDIPDEVDLAVIIVPPQIVPQAVNDCGQKGVKGAVVISAGFKETGPEGLRLENELIATAKRYGTRVLGPNCIGFIDTETSLNATFASGMAFKGNIAFMSQSGALCQAVLDWSQESKIGFSKFVSLGNKADINESDLLEAWKTDRTTDVVIAYLEGITGGERFRKAASALTRVKPLILLKAGATAAGSRAAASHTGTLAGFDTAYSAVFKQSGVIRVNSMEELFDFALAFAYQPLSPGDAIAIVTNAGGPGIMASDACERAGLRLAQFNLDTVEKLRSRLPRMANLYNPVDVIGDAGPDRYRTALDAVISDPNVDGVLVLLTPQAVTDVGKTAQAVIEAAEKSDKPIMTSFMGGPAVSPGIIQLTQNSVPNYSFPERAIESFSAMSRYRVWRNKKPEKFVSFRVNYELAGEILTRAREEKRHTLSDIEARRVIGAYGIPLPHSGLSHSPDEAMRIAKTIGYPVVMKIASPDILHKTDIGGVKINLDSAEAVKNAYTEILEASHRLMPDAQILGVDVQTMLKGREVILGMNRDPQFGPLLMFGLGGIYVEVLKDVSFRVAPLTRRDAEEMIQEIRSYPLLSGVRGERPADTPAVVDSLLRLSQLVMDFPILSELDVNPLMVLETGKGAVALDCRMGISV